MEDHGDRAFEGAVALYRRVGWIALLLGVLCRAIGYSRMTISSITVADASFGYWPWLTLLEIGLVLLVLGGAVIAITVYCELRHMSRKP